MGDTGYLLGTISGKIRMMSHQESDGACSTTWRLTSGWPFKTYDDGYGIVLDRPANVRNQRRYKPADLATRVIFVS